MTGIFTRSDNVFSQKFTVRYLAISSFRYAFLLVYCTVYSKMEP